MVRVALPAIHALVLELSSVLAIAALPANMPPAPEMASAVFLSLPLAMMLMEPTRPTVVTAPVPIQASVIPEDLASAVLAPSAT